jgi:hypothetical protein
MAEPDKFATLPNLGWFEPRRWLPTSIVSGFTVGSTSALGIQIAVSGGKTAAQRTPSTRGTTAEQKLRSFSERQDGALMELLNRQLAGERDFPAIGSALGAILGKLGIDFASALYSAANSLIGKTEKSAHVFVRDGDEIWRTEAIGKQGMLGTQGEPVYVATYLLVDPYRTNNRSRAAWILHEERYPLVA